MCVQRWLARMMLLFAASDEVAKSNIDALALVWWN